MALVGFVSEAQRIEAAMATIRKELGVRPWGAATTLGAGADKRKHRMSAAGRRHIAAAQRKRWKAFHAAQAAPKRNLSPAAKAKLVANLAKARAAKAAKASPATTA